MIIIAHRGNLNGPCQTTENEPRHIANVLGMGFHVEIDVRLQNNKWLLGHDEDCLHPVDYLLFHDPRVWCHAKDLAAFTALQTMGVACFWHQEDAMALTTKGYLWVHPYTIRDFPEFKPDSKTVLVLPEKQNLDVLPDCYGICTDFANNYRSNIGSQAKRRPVHSLCATAD